ncbi:MAG: signal recognition particle protein [Gammaproteobacteria bacterium]|nr:signal recognition particle protein [Gammaproteobacteria bacterium]
MFQQLSDRITTALKHVRGQGRISEDNIKKTLKEVRQALLEADVALDVITDFLGRVKRCALGREVSKSLNPGQAFIKVVKRELTELMGENQSDLNLQTQPPAVILMAGLQGSGKTTSSAKLARYIRDQRQKKVLLVSTDIYRPAAMEQLQILADQLQIDCYPASPSQKPTKIAEEALKEAKRKLYDVLIVDTAGRLHIDEEMMSEVKSLHTILDPIETFFVVDSMTGQDAANTAKVFNDALELTGVILTKLDGDARGGAALSIRAITGKPIKFVGMGEKVDALEVFHPERMASRILGMGDMMGLIESLEQKVDRSKVEAMTKKIMQGKSFTLDDFADQLGQMANMGGMSALIDKMPGMGHLSEQIKSKVDDKKIKRMVAIVQSMTKKERRNPDLIKNSQKRRIAAGCGQQILEVNRLLKQYEQMAKMMKKMGKGGGMMKMMQGLGSMMPGGFKGMV